MTEPLARAAGTDAGNAQMRKAGRKAWNRADLDLASSTFNRLCPDPFQGERFRLVNRESGAGDQTPPLFQEPPVTARKGRKGTPHADVRSPLRDR